MRIRRSIGLLLILAGVVCIAWGCAARQPMRGQAADDLDRKLSTFVYIEEGDLLSFIVGTRATRYREKSPYMPLEICIGNRGLKQLTLTRESFTLVDEEGNRYPAASPRELMESYDFLDLDRQSLAELDGIIFNKFATFTRYPSKFSPTRTSNPARTLAGSSELVRDMVSLPRFGYLVDFIYFPLPQTGLMNKRFELFLESPDLEDPVFVRFVVK